MPDDDYTIDDLSPEERATYYRTRRRTDVCDDGLCGGCPACLAAQGITDENL